MKDIKTRPTDRTPRVMDNAARVPKELARRSLISAKEQANEVAERQQSQSEQPEQYAEERVERTAEDAVHRVGNEAAQRGKQLARKASAVTYENSIRKHSEGRSKTVPIFLLLTAMRPEQGGNALPAAPRGCAARSRPFSRRLKQRKRPHSKRRRQQRPPQRVRLRPRSAR